MIKSFWTVILVVDFLLEFCENTCALNNYFSENFHLKDYINNVILTKIKFSERRIHKVINIDVRNLKELIKLQEFRDKISFQELLRKNPIIKIQKNNITLIEGKDYIINRTDHINLKLANETDKVYITCQYDKGNLNYTTKKFKQDIKQMVYIENRGNFIIFKNKVGIYFSPDPLEQEFTILDEKTSNLKFKSLFTTDEGLFAINENKTLLYVYSIKSFPYEASAEFLAVFNLNETNLGDFINAKIMYSNKLIYLAFVKGIIQFKLINQFSEKKYKEIIRITGFRDGFIFVELIINDIKFIQDKAYIAVDNYGLKTLNIGLADNEFTPLEFKNPFIKQIDVIWPADNSKFSSVGLLLNENSNTFEYFIELSIAVDDNQIIVNNVYNLTSLREITGLITDKTERFTYIMSNKDLYLIERGILSVDKSEHDKLIRYNFNNISSSRDLQFSFLSLKNYSRDIMLKSDNEDITLINLNRNYKFDCKFDKIGNYSILLETYKEEFGKIINYTEKYDIDIREIKDDYLFLTIIVITICVITISIGILIIIICCKTKKKEKSNVIQESLISI